MGAISEETRATLWSAKQHRLTIGILGTTMPFVVALVAGALWFTELQSSVSQYYYSGMGAYFVGVLFAIGLLLMSYVGHDKDDDTLLSDNAAGNLAGIFSIGTALIPTTPAYHATHSAKIAGYFHHGSAILFFVMLIYFCLVLFPKSGVPREEWGKSKIRKNRIFKLSGYTMVGCMIMLGLYAAFGNCSPSWFTDIQPIFLLETIMVMAFGISWLVKGGAFFKDPDEPTKPELPETA